jgi:hypothetical protein
LEEGQEPVAAGQHVENVGIYLRYGREPMSASPARRDVGICNPEVHTYIHTRQRAEVSWMMDLPRIESHEKAQCLCSIMQQPTRLILPHVLQTPVLGSPVGVSEGHAGRIFLIHVSQRPRCRHLYCTASKRTCSGGFEPPTSPAVLVLDCTMRL